jgi:hypothetical protein
MGTRADFYIGKGENAEWLGAIAWDGYPDGIDDDILKASNCNDFKLALKEFLKDRDDVSLPSDGWPWPWDDSNTTDYAYAFDNEKVYASCFGSNWFDPLDEDEDVIDKATEESIFPNMKDKSNVQLSGNKSGLIVVGLAGK